MRRARDAGRLPILTGGSGLYFAVADRRASRRSRTPAAARTEARSFLAESARRRCTRGSVKWTRRPPPGSAPPTASGSPAPGRCGSHRHRPRRLAGEGPRHPAPWRFAAILLDPPRTELRAAIAARFAAMLGAGALDEVRALLALRLDPALPAMRAHGVPELSAHLRGELTLEAAAAGSNWSPGSTPSARRPGSAIIHLPSPRALAYYPCADRGSREIFGKKYPGILIFLESTA